MFSCNIYGIFDRFYLVEYIVYDGLFYCIVVVDDDVGYVILVECWFEYFDEVLCLSV